MVPDFVYVQPLLFVKPHVTVRTLVLSLLREVPRHVIPEAGPRGEGRLTEVAVEDVLVRVRRLEVFVHYRGTASGVKIHTCIQCVLYI